MEIKISEHVKVRYCERIMNKNDKGDAAVFLANNQQKVIDDITKLVEYGELIYQGRSIVEYNKQPVRIYLNGTWVIVVDDKKNNVVTLYSIDLGVGKEFNENYINKLLDKLNEAKEEYSKTEAEIENNKEDYTKIIEDNNNVINEYRRIIKQLEQDNAAYKEVIENLDVKKTIAEKDVRDIVATLIGKSVF